MIKVKEQQGCVWCLYFLAQRWETIFATIVLFSVVYN